MIGSLIAVLAASLGIGAPEAKAPIYLSTEDVAGGVRLQVIGAADTSYGATFVLEVSGGTGNQSRHQGSAELRAGDRAVLSTVTIGVPPQGKWRARLRVEPVGAEPYEQTAASD